MNRRKERKEEKMKKEEKEEVMTEKEKVTRRKKEKKEKEKEKEEEEEDAIVIITGVKTTSVRDIQRLYIPSPLLLSLGGRVGGHLRVSLTRQTSVIGRTAPTLDTHTTYGYQVVMCGCVVEYRGVYGSVVENTGVNCTHRITPDHITPLEEVVIDIITVKVIVGNVKDVLNYRKNKIAFNTSIQSLLSLYTITNHSTIHFHNNPLADLLGVTLIEIQDCSEVKEGQVGVIGAGTEVNVLCVESEDRRRMSVRSKDVLGGLDGILDHLRRLVAEPWERRKEFAQAGVVYPSGKIKRERVNIDS